MMLTDDVFGEKSRKQAEPSLKKWRRVLECRVMRIDRV